VLVLGGFVLVAALRLVDGSPAAIERVLLCRAAAGFGYGIEVNLGCVSGDVKVSVGYVMGGGVVECWAFLCALEYGDG